VRRVEELHKVKEDRNIVETIIRRLRGLVTPCIGNAF